MIFNSKDYHFTEELFDSIKDIENLVIINSNINDEDIKNLTNLISLKIVNNETIKGKYFKNFTKLNTLKLDGTFVSDIESSCLKKLSMKNHKHTFDFDHNFKVDILEILKIYGDYSKKKINIKKEFNPKIITFHHNYPYMDKYYVLRMY